jgi:hypothetical protein
MIGSRISDYDATTMPVLFLVGYFSDHKYKSGLHIDAQNTLE